MPKDPFVGLQPFDTKEALIFFGRKEQTIELLERLYNNHFLAVIGSSGCGKSSLVRAGLIPKLKAGMLVEDRDYWFISKMKPGDNPWRSISNALLETFPEIKHNIESLGKLMFESHISGIIEVFGEIINNRKANLLLLVDQFEEIFRYEEKKRSSKEKEEEANFVSLMLSLAEQREIPIYVVMTMRSDFIGDCDKFLGLPEAINQSIYLVPRLTRKQLREAIENPIILFGQTITTRLQNRLLNDTRRESEQLVGEESDQLPVLQHALMRTWDNWKETDGKSFLDIRHYEFVGTISDALTRDANDALSGMTVEELKLTERIFKRLTDTDHSNRQVRRPAYLSDIKAVAKSDREQILNIIERFRTRNRNFLVLSEANEKGDVLIDISHESLIRKWDTLRTWVSKEAESRSMYRRLVESALRYKEGEGNLWRDPELQSVLNWKEEFVPDPDWAIRYNKHCEEAIPSLEQSEPVKAYLKPTIGLDDISEQEREKKVAQIYFKLAMEFLDASKDKRQEEIKEAEEKRNQELIQAQALATAERQRAEAEQQRAETQTRSNKRLRWLVAMVTIVFLVAAGLAVYAFQQSQVANDQAMNAENGQTKTEQANIKERHQRKIAEKKQRDAENAGAAEKKQRQIAENRRIEAEKAKEAEKIERQRADVNAKVAEENLTKAEKERDEKERQRQRADVNAKVAEENLTKAEKERDEKERQRQRADDNAKAAEENLTKAEKERDEKEKQRQRAEELSTKNLARRLAVQSDSLSGSSSELGILLAVESVKRDPSSDNVQALRDRLVGFGKGGAYFAPDSDKGYVYSVVFSPNSKYLALACSEGLVVWELSNGSLSRKVMSFGGKLNSVAFSKDSKFLATAGKDKTARVRKVPSGEEVISMSHEDEVYSVAFSSDGNRIATACKDTARIWEISSDKGPIVISHKGSKVYSVAFSPDGKSLATASGDKTARIWDASSGNKVRSMSHEGEVYSVAFSSDGKSIATACKDTARIWEVPGGKEVGRISHKGKVYSVAFSPDGNSVATACGDGSAWIWDVSNTVELSRMNHKSEVYSVAFSSDGRFLATAGRDGTARIWFLNGEDLIDRAFIHIKRNLNHKEWLQYIGKDEPYRKTFGGLPDFDN